MPRITFLLVFALIVSACNSTYKVTVYNLEPAPVVLSKDIRRIGIINEAGNEDLTEGTASLEALVHATDQRLALKGREAALEGLQLELQRDKRFDTVMILQNSMSLWTNARTQKQEVPWPEFKALCIQNNLDAIFSLALYHTDTRISEKRSSMEEVDMLRMKVVVPARELTLETLIENGWRIYDPFEEEVLDEITVREQVISQAKGENTLNALRAMTDRADSLVSISRGSGSSYGMRLKPMNKPVERDIYIKGSEFIAQARTAVQDGDWLEAARLWQSDLNHEKMSVRGKACHNMAVLFELKNDLDQALEWATLAKTHDEREHMACLEALKACAQQKSEAEKQWESIALLRNSD